MSDMMTSTPVVMSITDHDPSGGGGISAAIETLSSLGCHCTPVITKLSARDTAGQKDAFSTDTSLLIEQMRAVLEDIPVNLIAIGDVGTISNTEAIHTVLNDYPDIPTVLNPPPPNGEADIGLDRAIRNLLLPQALIAVFNKREALSLAASADTLSACAQELMEDGCNNLLITNTNSTGNKISNHWFSPNTQKKYEFERLPQKFHGGGCTLAAALSAYLSHQLSLTESIKQAQQFTFQALKKARRVGMGELIPDRLHWCR